MQLIHIHSTDSLTTRYNIMQLNHIHSTDSLTTRYNITLYITLYMATEIVSSLAVETPEIVSSSASPHVSSFLKWRA